MARTADEYRRYRWAREKRHSILTGPDWDIRAHEDRIKPNIADHADVDEVDAQWNFAMVGRLRPNACTREAKNEHDREHVEMDQRQA